MKRLIFVLIIIKLTLALTDTKLTCQEGEFKQYYYGKHICRKCSSVYKNCDTCDPGNLNTKVSFCTQCRWFYQSMTYDDEKTAVIAQMKRRSDRKVNPEDFQWECSFNTPMVIFIILGFLILVGSSIGYGIYKRKLRIKEQIKKRREKERQWGRLIQ